MLNLWLKAEMDKPWSFNHKTKKAFTVISPIDINKAEYQVCNQCLNLCPAEPRYILFKIKM